MGAPYRGILERLAGADGLLGLLARLVFAATLLVYFWASARTKLGDGLVGLFPPSAGAHVQIFPRAMEAVSYDASQLETWHRAVVLAGTLAEFLLPLLIVAGLLTRLAALGMIGFIALQTMTDLHGHGAIDEPATLGAWFDRVPDSAIMDQRIFWIFVLIVLVVKGPGPLSLDRLLSRRTWLRRQAPPG
ncbi:DoxX family protein [Sulfitobacter sp. LCG007]